MPLSSAAPLRCYLLIGPPASGKTTLAITLAPLLTGPSEPPAFVLSTDAIRTEVFGDPAVQGPWIDIQQRLQQRLFEAVAAGIPVIIDATHARRPWRLALTQALLLPAPVEWIGWCLYTPLPTCLEWNRHRERQVPEAVIQEMAAALADPHFGPSRAEGFAALCTVVPTHHDDLEPLLAALALALAGIGLQLVLRLWIRRQFLLPITFWWLMGAGGLVVAAIGPVSVWRTLSGRGWTWKGRPLA